MTATPDLALVDANVWIYAVDSLSAFFPRARRLVERATSSDAGLCVAPQTFAEFFAVVTNPRRVAHPKTADEAIDAIETMRSLPGLILLPVPVDVVSMWCLGGQCWSASGR